VRALAPSVRILLGVALALAACKPAPKAPLVDKLGVEATGLDWPKGEARKRFEEKLFATGAFIHLKEKDARPGGVPVWNLALSLQVVEPAEGAQPADALAIGRLGVENSEGLEQEVVVTSVEKVAGPGLDEWREAARGAAIGAMQKAVDGARALVAAVGKSDPELVAQLESKDMQQQEWAAAVLAERKNPAARPVLEPLLANDDLMKARWAMRFLLRLGDARSASAFIEASRHKDDTFQREIVFALGELGGEEAEAYLFTVAEGHDLPLMRQSAERALGELRARRLRDGGVKP
jgi:hypothetical protein